MNDPLSSGLLNPDETDPLDCDVAIIGSGGGGSTAAVALASAGLDVLIIEEGSYIPATAVPSSATESFRQMWRNGGLTAALGRTPISYAEGRCVGGSTEINSAIFQRPAPQLFDQWSDTYRIDDFNESSLTPHFDWAAGAVSASATKGPLGPASDILKNGGEKLGWKISTLERGQKGCVGTNLCSFGCPTGGKQSMTASLLPLAVAHGCRILPESRVRKINRAGARVQSVTVGRRGPGRVLDTRIVTARKAVFLAAGAINTPALLLQNGLAGRSVGKTLRLHPSVRVLADFKDPVHAFDHRLPLYAVSEFLPDQRIGGSVMTPATFGLALAENWPHRAELLARPEHAAGYYAMARAEGNGTIRCLPGLDDPIVHYGLTSRDWRLLTECLARLTRVLFAAGATRVYPGISGHPGWRSPGAALAELGDPLNPKRTQLMTIHMFSSCRMGQAQACDVDSFGRVKDMENLFVSDASLIPEAMGVNPQATVMALARRTAHAYLDRSK